MSSRADLLVLGARGSSFMRHLVLGSTAERLVRRSDRPLQVVKRPPHERYQRVLVAVDFARSSLATLATARAVAPHADLVVIGKQDETVTEEFLLGSVTKHVLQQSQSDVLISV